MGLSIAMGLAYDAAWFELNAQGTTLSEEYYFNYEQAFMFYMFEAMARSHQDVKDFRKESWYMFMEPDDPYKCTLGNLGQYAISLIGEFNQIYNYLKGRFDTTEWDDMGFEVYDPIYDTTKTMS